MSLLYQCGDELILEMTIPAMEWVIGALDEALNGKPTGPVEVEVANFANALRSEIQHRPQPPSDNSDLV